MQRPEWIRRLVSLATPPLSALAEGRLLADVPFPEAAGGPYLRREFASLEILSRTLLGVAPWLELIDVPENEAAARERMRQLALAALERSLDPASPDNLNFSTGRPPLVNAAFLAQACSGDSDLLREAVLYSRLGLCDQIQFGRANVFEVLRDDMRHGVALRPLLQFTGYPGALGTGEDRFGVWFFFSEGPVVEIGCVLNMFRVPRCIQLNIKHSLGHYASFT